MSVWDTPIDEALLDERQKGEHVLFLGQNHIVAQVEPFLDDDKFPHVLLSGDPGLGKTQFARWVAWRRGRPFYERLAPVNPEELPVYGVMLLDEVHRQRNIEALFPVMDKGILSVIAATTKPEKLDSAFRSRFLLDLRLKPYSQEEMESIVKHMAGEHFDEIPTFARASAGNPRQAARIVRTAQSLGTWDPNAVLQRVQVTADGLTADHWAYLDALEKMGRPTGISQIVEVSRLDPSRASAVERLLHDRGLVEYRSNGRKLTIKGEQYVSVLRDEALV